MAGTVINASFPTQATTSTPAQPKTAAQHTANQETGALEDRVSVTLHSLPDETTELSADDAATLSKQLAGNNTKSGSIAESQEAPTPNRVLQLLLVL